MGKRLRVLILSNRDPTSSTIFRAICEDPRLAITGIAFTTTLTRCKGFWRGVWHIFRRSGLRYFIYLLFWNGIFSAKEWLIWYLPFLRHIFRYFFSLKLWARENDSEILFSEDFNSSEFLAGVTKHQPDLILTRVNQILKGPILNSATFGCWCFHSSELPSYQGIAAEFHSMLNGEKKIGFTVMQMEAKLDAGPIIAQASAPIPEGVTLHGLIKYNNTFAHEVIRKAMEDLFAGCMKYSLQDLSRKTYFSWPTPDETRVFGQKGLHFISFREMLSYLFE
jgi:folate-dependent phosphoribosylglycinamide formyltransferase PurN